MIAPVTALSLLSMDPSPAVVQQAQNAAGTRHGLVNFTRLVRSLDKQRLEAGPGASWLEVQKTWEVGSRAEPYVLYLFPRPFSTLELCYTRYERSMNSESLLS